MHKIIVTAISTFILGSLTAGALVARAQPASAPPMPPPAASGPMNTQPGTGPDPGPGPGMGSGMGSGRMGPGRMEGGRMEGGRMGADGDPMGERMHADHAEHREMMRAFALMHRADDRKLTPPDVQKIAEAFLLWNGNHTWKVINVARDGEVIGFDLAAAEGGVIARFTMDPKTGKLKRRG